jgi:hypothetical protein
LPAADLGSDDGFPRRRPSLQQRHAISYLEEKRMSGSPAIDHVADSAPSVPPTMGSA